MIVVLKKKKLAFHTVGRHLLLCNNKVTDQSPDTGGKGVRELKLVLKKICSMFLLRHGSISILELGL